MALLELYEGDLLGSIKRIDAALVNQFTSFNPAVFASGYAWQEIGFTDESAQLRLSVQDSEQGSIFKYTGRFSIPKLRSIAEDALLQINGKKAVLKITDMNDRVYIIGSPYHPVTIEIDGDTGMEYRNASSYTLNFAIEQTWQAFSA